jgi:hypothetical protein
VTIFVPSKTAVEYYDSLGDWPPVVPEISKYLGQFGHINYNRQKLQSERSDACGKHAIYFLCRRCSGMPFGKIIGNLRKCKSGADRLVNEYVRNIFSN